MLESETVESLRLELAACRRQLEQYQFSLESGQVGDWDLDLVTDTSRRSLRHDRCFGYATALVESAWGARTFIEHVHPDDRVQVETSFRAAVTESSDWASEFTVSSMSLAAMSKKAKPRSRRTVPSNRTSANAMPISDCEMPTSRKFSDSTCRSSSVPPTTCASSK